MSSVALGLTYRRTVRKATNDTVVPAADDQGDCSGLNAPGEMSPGVT